MILLIIYIINLLLALGLLTLLSSHWFNQKDCPNLENTKKLQLWLTIAITSVFAYITLLIFTYYSNFSEYILVVASVAVLVATIGTFVVFKQCNSNDSNKFLIIAIAVASLLALGSFASTLPLSSAVRDKLKKEREIKERKVAEKSRYDRQTFKQLITNEARDREGFYNVKEFYDPFDVQNISGENLAKVRKNVEKIVNKDGYIPLSDKVYIKSLRPLFEKLNRNRKSIFNQQLNTDADASTIKYNAEEFRLLNLYDRLKKK